MKYASFGSISHGTMREEDLLPTFAYELEYHVNRNTEEWTRNDECRKEHDDYLDLANEARELINEEDGSIKDEGRASEVLELLFDALQNFAPPYAYFGANEGDGSDYGFWLSEDFQDNFDGLQVRDLSEVPEDYCDSVKAGHVTGEVLLINDHGNMSLYQCDGEGKLSKIWSVV